MNPRPENALTLAAMRVFSVFLLVLIWYSTSIPGNDLPRVNTAVGLVSSSLAHFLGFCLFCACLYSAMRLQQLTLRFVIVLAIATLLAIATELHQRSVPGRDADITDGIIDLIGYYRDWETS